MLTSRVYILKKPNPPKKTQKKKQKQNQYQKRLKNYN